MLGIIIKGKTIRLDMARGLYLVMVGMLVWALVGVGFGSGAQAAAPAKSGTTTQAAAGSYQFADRLASPDVTCPNDQCFADVPSSNGFYANINALYIDGIIGGYACGGAGEPCDSQSRPYYRPGNPVTRQQMAKFADLSRRNISDAIGHSLYISTTAGIAGDFETRSGGEAVYAECIQSGNNCYALEGYAPTGDYAGYMYGGKGVYAESDDASQPGLDAASYGANAYAMSAESAAYRAGYVKSDSNVLYSLFVDSKDGPTQTTAALNVRGTVRVEGNLTVLGSKSGYVVDVMQNVGTVVLEPGDVVTIVGNGSPVLGEIPVVTVKKSTTAYDSGVVGVVDQVVYVPNAPTKAAYDKQEEAIRAANDRRNQATADAKANGGKPDMSGIVMPVSTITDEQGTVHAISGATQVAPSGYMNVVTLGSYKAIKVDASFGAVHAGDTLVSSPHAGYAMKATDKLQSINATLGKALGDLASGTGLVPVMVTLK